MSRLISPCHKLVTRPLVCGLVLAALFVGTVAAEDAVGVNGSKTRYATVVEHKVGDKQVKLVLTGAALRKRAFFSVYTIASYVDASVSVGEAQELAEKDCAKQLHLIMERDVGGRDMAEAFVGAIRQNYAAPRFAEQLASLSEFMMARNVKKGDHVWLTHIPKVGLHCQIVGKTDVLIEDVPFTRAVWEIYFGNNNIGEALKRDLSARLVGDAKK